MSLPFDLTIQMTDGDLFVKLCDVDKCSTIVNILLDMTTQDATIFLGIGTKDQMLALLKYHKMRESTSWDLSTKERYPDLYEFFAGMNNEFIRELAKLALIIGFPDLVNKCCFFYEMRTGVTLNDLPEYQIKETKRYTGVID